MTAHKQATLSTPDSEGGPTADLCLVGPPNAQTFAGTSAMLSSQRARLIYCKSHVSIHPTQFDKDNISGYLALVETDDVNGSSAIVAWVPDQVLERMDKQDRDSFQKVESHGATSEDEKEYVFISLPPPKGEQYAFSVPVSNLYSILVYPPSLQYWYGSATFNLSGGVSLPTLFFHDDESPMLEPSPAATNSRSKWGFPPFLSLLQTRSSLLRSRLLTGNGKDKAELWLVNPSRSDREVHEADLDESPSYPPGQGFPDPKVLINQPTPKQTLLAGLSNITSFSRKISQQIISHPLAREVVPHLPPAVRSLVNAPGEWDSSGSGRVKKDRTDVASEFEAARLYLARWARVVAEEGEKARRDEVARQAGTNQTDVDELAGSLGVFSLLSSPNSSRPLPHPTRRPFQPITSRDWEAFAAQGRDEYYVRREIFQRGFSNSDEPAAKQARRDGWEVLLGTVPWEIGGVGGGESGREKRLRLREERRETKRAEYATLKAGWKNDAAARNQESWKEEWHRIDVDCRRTDRAQPIFAIPSESTSKTQRQPPASLEDEEAEEEEGGMTRLNHHIAALRNILMTYHTHLPELGYVQGMSDLLSPIYVVFKANEADAFWGLVGVMKIMQSNFLRDQSGMKWQLSMLQQLIGVMDPELYGHLEKTGSLNLFFCFRWILIAFKREFKFEDVISLWEVLWTNLYSNHFVLFVALAILQSHRDVLIRYLAEFDEVLKYANDLSGTIDLQTTLNQAEVLFLQFKGVVEDFDVERLKVPDGLRRRGEAGKDPADDALQQRVKVIENLRELLKGFQAKS